MGADYLKYELIARFESEKEYIRAITKLIDEIKRGSHDAELQELEKQGLIEIYNFYDSEDIQESISKTLAKLRDILEGSRECNLHNKGKYIILETGGLSYGDAPTDDSLVIDNIYGLYDFLKDKLNLQGGIDTMQLFFDEYEQYLDSETIQKIKQIKLALKV